METCLAFSSPVTVLPFRMCAFVVLAQVFHGLAHQPCSFGLTCQLHSALFGFGLPRHFDSLNTSVNPGSSFFRQSLRFKQSGLRKPILSRVRICVCRPPRSSRARGIDLSHSPFFLHRCTDRVGGDCCCTGSLRAPHIRSLPIHPRLCGRIKPALVPLRARARLPPRATQVAELRLAETRHVVAAQVELDHAAAPGAP